MRSLAKRAWLWLAVIVTSKVSNRQFAYVLVGCAVHPPHASADAPIQDTPVPAPASHHSLETRVSELEPEPGAGAPEQRFLVGAGAGAGAG